MSSFDERLGAFAIAIAEARDAAEAGGLLDLTGLAGAAETICAEAIALPAGERRQAAERLAGITRGLDTLAAAIAAQHKGQDEGAGSRSTRAERAYRGAPGRDG